MFCPKCGSKLSDNAIFCSNCGNKVNSDSNNKSQNNNTKNLNKYSFGSNSILILVVSFFVVAFLVLIIFIFTNFIAPNFAKGLKIVKNQYGREYFEDDGQYFYNQWIEYKDNWYYSDNEGYIAKDIFIDGYYLGHDGKMLKSIIWENPVTGIKHYFNDEGKMLFNDYVSINDKIYAIDNQGAIIIHRFFRDLIDHSKIRYADKNGVIVYGDCFVELDGNTFFINEEGFVVVSAWVKYKGDYYYLLTNGVLARSMWIERTYYVDKNGKMLYSTKTPDGYEVDDEGKIIGRLKSERSNRYILKFVSSDVSEYPIIKLYYKIYDTSGRVINDFNVQEIVLNEKNNLGTFVPRVVKKGEIISQKYATNTSLVVDRSTSLNSSDLQKIKNAMTTFVYGMDQLVGDKTEIISFGSDIINVCSYTNNLSELVNGINSISLSGSTALYDAIYRGISHASNQNGARCVIAFTDGHDNESSHTIDDVINYSIKQQVPIYIVGVGSSVSTNDLNRIATSTGGRYYSIHNVNEMSKIYTSVYNDEKSTYYIEYTTDNLPSLKYALRDVQIVLDNGVEFVDLDTNFVPPSKTTDDDNLSNKNNDNLKETEKETVKDNTITNTQLKLEKDYLINEQYDWDEDTTVTIKIKKPIVEGSASDLDQINKHIDYAMSDLLNIIYELIDDIEEKPKTVNIYNNTLSYDSNYVVIKMSGVVTLRKQGNKDLNYTFTYDRNTQNYEIQ